MKNIYPVYKPKGPTSFDVIQEIKDLTGETRIGHAGTLDPLASGVLVVGIGREATKELDKIVESEKKYIADIKLGVRSETDDDEGRKQEIKKLRNQEIKKTEIQKIIKSFIGVIDQVPPQFSAIKVDGKRAYKSARQGQEVKLKSRSVEIKDIKIVKYKYPDLKIKVTCGKGTYIRSLARDIGEALGTGAYLADLERTMVGQFTKAKAVKLEKIKQDFEKEIIKKLQTGQIGVMPTDTIYGLVGLALNRQTVERIYEVRKRQPDKPFIILVSAMSDLKKFGIKLDQKIRRILNQYWPGPVSIILDCPSQKLAYLHRGTKSLAFRLPAKPELVRLLKKTGPLVAPSGNPEGLPPAKTIKQAKKYFSNQVDFYVSVGKLEAKPSALIKLEHDDIIILRK